VPSTGGVPQDGRVDPDATPNPHVDRLLPGSPGFRAGRATVVVVLLVSYLVVLVGYAQSTVGAGISQRPQVPAGGVGLLFVPTGIDATAGAMTGLMYVLPGEGLTDEDGHLSQDLAVSVQPVIGSGYLTFPAGQAPAPESVTLALQGHVRDYPFDSYQGDLVSEATTRSSTEGAWTPVPVAVGAEGELGGWVLSFSAPSSVRVEEGTYATADGYGIQSLGARRSVSTIAVALLVLLLMVLLAVLAALVARSVALQRRRVEPSLAGWMGAMLFALVPLRNFLPGAPPLGSWIDVLVFFWVEIVIMVALAVYVSTWLRDGPPSERQ
jgi:hypothetical protein